MNLNDLKIIPTPDVESPPFFYLQQFYEFEFSCLTNSDTDYNGLYDYKALQASWNNHHYHAYLAYLNQLPVGFAVVNLNSQIDNNPNTRDIAEFFIMPKYRRAGIGKNVAIEIFNRYPGNWEVRQLPIAATARLFWIQTINNYTKGNYTEILMNDPKWNGYVQKFTCQ